MSIFVTVVHWFFFPTSVRQAREAALDAHLLVLATDLGKEKASQLHADGSAFDLAAYAEHLVSKTRIRM